MKCRTFPRRFVRLGGEDFLDVKKALYSAAGVNVNGEIGTSFSHVTSLATCAREGAFIIF